MGRALSLDNGYRAGPLFAWFLAGKCGERIHNGDGMSPKVLWDVVRAGAARAGIDKLAPHDLRRIGARLCRLVGRRTGSNPIPARPRLDPDDGARYLGMQAEAPGCCERPIGH